MRQCRGSCLIYSSRMLRDALAIYICFVIYFNSFMFLYQQPLDSCIETNQVTELSRGSELRAQLQVYNPPPPSRHSQHCCKPCVRLSLLDTLL
jgi:hypothetical protein